MKLKFMMWVLTAFMVCTFVPTVNAATFEFDAIYDQHREYSLVISFLSDIPVAAGLGESDVEYIAVVHEGTEDWRFTPSLSSTWSFHGTALGISGWSDEIKVTALEINLTVNPFSGLELIEDMEWIEHLTTTPPYEYVLFSDMGTLQAVPIPSTLLLFGAGLVGLAGVRKKCKR